MKIKGNNKKANFFCLISLFVIFSFYSRGKKSLFTRQKGVNFSVGIHHRLRRRRPPVDTNKLNISLVLPHLISIIGKRGEEKIKTWNIQKRKKKKKVQKKRVKKKKRKKRSLEKNKERRKNNSGCPDGRLLGLEVSLFLYSELKIRVYTIHSF